MDGRKRDNPRDTLITFRAEAKTAQKLRDEAKSRNVSVSQHINDKLTK